MGILKSAVLVLVTAVAVMVLPSLFKKKLPTVGRGYTAPRWQRVANVFRDHLDSGHEEGAAFAVYHRGEMVVEFSGGYANPQAEWGWSKELLTGAYSATKGVSAIMVAMLVDRGLLQYEQPVATYWPEFAQQGKEKITVRQLVSHQAGLPILDEKFTVQDITEDAHKVGRILAQQKPMWPPGTAHGYHSLSYGLYIDHLIKRVDPQHRDISQFFREEIAEPFGIDFYIGLPLKENYRCPYTYSPTLWRIVKTANLASIKVYLYLAFRPEKLLTLKTVANPHGNLEHFMNNPFVRVIPCGASRGFGTAMSLAKLYGIITNGGQLEGRQLLSTKTIQEMVKPVVSGIDEILKINLTYAAGMMIRKSKTGNDMFGTPGHGGQIAFGDLKHKIGWAYLTNHLRYEPLGQDARYQPLEEAIYDTIRNLAEEGLL